MKNFNKAFTLIELLIVIVIIGILAVALIPRLVGMQGKARNVQRIADLKAIQSALELYQSEKGSYPVTFVGPGSGTLAQIYTGYQGNCLGYGYITNYIPNLVPTYITSLPMDPKPIQPWGCYAYRSNGENYIIVALFTIEGSVPEAFKRNNPLLPNDNTYVLYSQGAKNR